MEVDIELSKKVIRMLVAIVGNMGTEVILGTDFMTPMDVVLCLGRTHYFFFEDIHISHKAKLPEYKNENDYLIVKNKNSKEGVAIPDKSPFLPEYTPPLIEKNKQTKVKALSTWCSISGSVMENPPRKNSQKASNNREELNNDLLFFENNSSETELKSLFKLESFTWDPGGTILLVKNNRPIRTVKSPVRLTYQG
jgi:hypothetical protein